jgi:hypothetical protein
MTRSLVAGGSLAVLMGLGLIPPVVAARLETGSLTMVGVAILFAAALALVGGTASIAASRRRQGPRMPSGVRAALMANGLVLGFLALELSDRIVRQNGNLIYWTTFLLVPALVTYVGLAAARGWAWWVVRAMAALGVLWFVGFTALIPFVQLQADGVPTPWYGRLYMICVSLAFAAIMAAAYWSLGRRETRSYFGFAGRAGLFADRTASPTAEGQ